MNVLISSPTIFKDDLNLENMIIDLLSDEYELKLIIPDLSGLIFQVRKLEDKLGIKSTVISANWIDDYEKAGEVRSLNLIKKIDFALIFDNTHCERTKHLLKLLDVSKIPFDQIIVNQQLDLEESSNFNTILNEYKRTLHEKEKEIKLGNYEYAAQLRDKIRKIEYQLEDNAIYSI